MRLNSFQRLALWTTVATYLLIAVGGLVRASGAGLGCPDWPKCFGLWIPPTDVSGVPAHIDASLFNVTKTWTEYVNRLLGVTVGFLILGTLVSAFRNYRKVPRVFYPTLAAFILVLLEGWIGGQVVKSQLKPLILTLHLVFALLVVSALLYATVSAFFPGGKIKISLSPERLKLARTTLAVSILLLVQIGLGAAVRGEVQIVAESGLARGEWLTQVGTLDVLHRNMAVLVSLAIFGLSWLTLAKAEPDPWLRRCAWACLLLVAGQVAAGFGLAYANYPPALQVLHLWFPSLLLGVFTLQVMLAYRLDPRMQEAS